MPKKPNTRQSQRTRVSNTCLTEGAEFQSRVRLSGGVDSDVSCVVSFRELVFSTFRGEGCGNQDFGTAHLRTYVVASWLELTQQSCASAPVSLAFLSAYVVVRSWYYGLYFFLELSSAQCSDAPPLEPSIEALLRERSSTVVFSSRLTRRKRGSERQRKKRLGLTQRKGLPTNANWQRL